MFMQFRFQLWQCDLWSNYMRLQSVWGKAILRRIELIISQWTLRWLFSATLLNNWRFIKSLIPMIMILLSNIDQKNEAPNVLEASTSFPDKYIRAKATLWISFSVNELPNYIDFKKIDHFGNLPVYEPLEMKLKKGEWVLLHLWLNAWKWTKEKSIWDLQYAFS